MLKASRYAVSVELLAVMTSSTTPVAVRVKGWPTTGVSGTSATDENLTCAVVPPQSDPVARTPLARERGKAWWVSDG